ncbi:MAG: glycoside hydrolase family 78 protein [Promethearchaeota archaeon]
MTTAPRVVGLRCDGMVDPACAPRPDPVLSWKVTGVRRRRFVTAAYQLQVATSPTLLAAGRPDAWDSGKVDEPWASKARYAGVELPAFARVHWRVRVWSDAGEESQWSETATFGVGPREPRDWEPARWARANVGTFRRAFSKFRRRLRPPVRPRRVNARPKPRTKSPCLMLRAAFDLKGPTTGATLHASALGDAHFRINGKAVSDALFLPDWTDYSKRVIYRAFDVTPLLREGENVLAAVVAPGWFAGRVFLAQSAWGGLDDLAVLALLLVRQKSGKVLKLPPEGAWKAWHWGPWLRADHFDGEVYDVERELALAGWDEPGFDESGWEPVATRPVGAGGWPVPKPAKCPPVRVHAELRPVESRQLAPGTWLFDFGQNVSGFCRLRFNPSVASPGARVTVRHAEVLDANGEPYFKNLRSALAEDVVFLPSDQYDPFEFQPKFTYHGFRYALVSGLDPAAKPPEEFVVALAITSEAPDAGGFECSEPDLDRLVRAAWWTLRNNFVSVPTDCHQRDERMGWAGDVLEFCRSSALLVDAEAFYRKWCADLRDGRGGRGKFPDFAPLPPLKRFFAFKGAPGWADCGAFLPWQVHAFYDAPDLLEEQFQDVKGFVDHVVDHNPDLVWRHSVGMKYGDWLNGSKVRARDFPRGPAEVPHDAFATAFLAQSATIASKIAGALGKYDDDSKYRELAARTREAFVSEFVDGDARVKGDAQASYALALSFDLLPPPLAEKAFAHLVEAVEREGAKPTTGFHSTHRMLLELSRRGRGDLALRMVLSREFPSWRYMLDRGATTTWERWDGLTPDADFQAPSMNSFCHFAFASVVEWLFSCLAGLAPDPSIPGFRRAILRPRPHPPLTWVEAWHEAPRGRFRVRWRVDGQAFKVDVDVPPNADARLVLPSLLGTKVLEKGADVESGRRVEGVLSCQRSGSFVELEVGSGSYSFETTTPGEAFQGKEKSGRSASTNSS